MALVLRGTPPESRPWSATKDAFPEDFPSWRNQRTPGTIGEAFTYDEGVKIAYLCSLVILASDAE